MPYNIFNHHGHASATFTMLTIMIMINITTTFPSPSHHLHHAHHYQSMHVQPNAHAHHAHRHHDHASSSPPPSSCKPSSCSHYCSWSGSCIINHAPHQPSWHHINHQIIHQQPSWSCIIQTDIIAAINNHQDVSTSLFWFICSITPSEGLRREGADDLLDQGGISRKYNSVW